MTTTIGFPYQVTAHGRTRLPSPDQRIRELMEMLLFTVPGERVMRPDLGTPVSGLLFEGLNDALAAALQASIQGALHQWLGDIVEVREVSVEAVDAALLVTIDYRGVLDALPRTIQFKRERP